MLFSRSLGTKRPAPRRRPHFDLLEDRLVPATFTVTTPLDVVNPHDGKLSLREAITRANHHSGTDTIVVPRGVYRLTRAGADDTNAAGDLDVTGSTLFRGAGAGKTIIDGQHLDRVFDVLGTAPHSIRVTLQGLTVRNGLADLGGGGGIRVGNADLVVKDCAVTGNSTTGDGGGISNAALPGTGNLTLIRSLIDSNVAHRGGGLSVRATSQNPGSVLTLSGTTIQGNLADTGGGIRASTVNLTTSTVSANTARGEGGGIFANTANLTNCIVSDNHAANGGGGGIDVGDVTLTNSTVSGNTATGRGGGIWAGTAMVIESTIRGNFASYGGAVQADMVTLTGSTLRGNFARDGGGIGADSVTLTNSTVSGNSAITGNGGGIFASDAVTLTNSTVSANTAASFGGGIFADRTAMLTDSTLSGNHAGADGGLLASTATLTNCTVSGNTADGDTGGLGASTAMLTNCTVSGNSAGGTSGGIGAVALTLLEVTVTDNSAHTGGGVLLGNGGTSSVRNSIIAKNRVDPTGTGPDLSGAFTSAGHNLIGNGSASTGFTNGANGDMVGTAANPIDPMLGPLANNGGPTLTHALLPGSPALDKGDNTGLPATDQRGSGFARVVGSAPDIGAFEVQPPSPPPPVVAIRMQRVGLGTRVDVLVDGTLRRRWFPFGAFKGRVQVQQRDVNGDGRLDVVAQAVINGKKRTRIFMI